MSKEIKKMIPELRFPEFVNDGEWVEKTLGLVAEIVTGTTPSTIETINYNGNRLFVSPADINDNRYITQTKTTLSDIGFSKTRKIKVNSVLFVCIGSTIGKVAQNMFECATNQQINSLIPYEGNSSDFLYSILDSNSKKIASIAGKHAVPLINKTSFSAIKLSFPPKLEEQEKIATCFSSLDEVIAAHSQRLDLLIDHKKGLMQNLFPQEGEKVPKFRFPEYREDGEWVEKILSEVANYENGKAHEQDISENGNFVVVNSKFISTDGEVAKYSFTAYCLADKGDVLMVLSDVPNGRAIAKCFYVNEENKYTVNQRICKITSFDCNSLFLYYVMNRNPYFLSFDDGVKQTNLRNDDVQSFPFLIPIDIKEQQKIASCLSSLDALITAQAEKITQLKLHKKGLMQGLFPKVNI